jgi:general secretion pathway protein D
MDSVKIKTGRVRRIIAVGLVLLIVSPLSAFADKKDKGNDKGKKHFKLGVAYEQNKQWDKAAQEFTLASAEAPSDIEYTLHLRVALVNAAIMLSHRGDMLADQKDFNAAYQSYRQAYSYDPSDEISLVKMRRMLEVQGLPIDVLPGAGAAPPGNTTRVETSYKAGGAPSGESPGTTPGMVAEKVAVNWVRKRYPPTDITWRGSLTAAIENVAHSMRLNVVFDTGAQTLIQRNTNYSIELEDVTPARALEIILQTNGLLYTQADTRTIIVAPDNPQSRQKYENQSVKTFYIKNADQKTVDDVKTALTQSIGMKQIIAYKELNALVARDTPETLELAENVIKSLDKSKAEVLIDVKLYEISKSDMLSLGNQFNTGDTSQPGGNPATANLATVGGIGIQGALEQLSPPRILKGPFGIGLTLPTSTISALADHSKSKQLASAQVHVLDGEQQQVKIGQRVPIQTATIPGFGAVSPTTTTGTTTTGTTTGLSGVNGTTTTTTSPTTSVGALGISGFPEIQYEDVGLTLDVTPTVYDEEVQVKLKVSSSSVTSTSTLTPTFDQRDITSVARVRNGQTSLVAAVSQIQESKDIKGIPFLSYIPVLGRLFATPNTSSTDDYVVITLTPHILRKADITDDDRLTRDSGPESNLGKRQLTLEEILYKADHEVTPELPVADAGAAPKLAASKDTPATGIVTVPTKAVSAPSGPGVVVTGAPTRQPSVQPSSPTQGTIKRVPAAKQSSDSDDDDDDDSQNALQVLVRAAGVATKGQQFTAAVIVSGIGTLTSATVSLTYDPNIFEVQAVRDAGMMSIGGVEVTPQTTIQPGIINVEIDRPPGAAPAPARGQLLYIVFSVKGSGTSQIALGPGTAFTSGNGQPVPLSLQPATVQVR